MGGLVSTVTLTNLGVANAGVPGRVLAIDLPEQTVAPGAGLMRITISTPDDYHLNSQAPASLDLKSSNAAVFAPGESSLTWSTDDQAIEISIPANATAGSATLTATGQMYYCRTGEEALCFIQTVEVTLPLRIAPGGAGEAVLKVALPAVD
jgi:hypothetical protein